MHAPLDVVLDTTRMGNEGRFARSGCWPNAVVRPVICVPSSSSSSGDSNSDSNLTTNGNGDGMNRLPASLSPQHSRHASPAIDRKGKGRVPPELASTREPAINPTAIPIDRP